MSQKNASKLRPEPVSWQLPGSLKLDCGQTLPQAELIYETYGELAPDKGNAVLICHALSGHHHAAGYYKGDQKPGWWDELIGPGKAMDSERFFIVSLNNLGGCHGSTGPASVKPGSDEPYGSSFPQVHVRDWVQTQALLADHLGIDRWHAVVGGSLGGMQALQWAVSYPERIGRCVAAAAAAFLSAQNIAFNFVARLAIEQGGQNASGMGLARMLGHLTYLSERGMAERFGRSLADVIQEGEGDKFSVEGYLEHQAKRFIESGFNVDTYLLMTHALDHFDLAASCDGDLVRALQPAQCRFLVVGFDSDWRFPPSRSRELVGALMQAGKRVSYLDIDSDKGHDSFLFALPRYVDGLRTFLELSESGQ